MPVLFEYLYIILPDVDMLIEDVGSILKAKDYRAGNSLYLPVDFLCSNSQICTVIYIYVILPVTGSDGSQGIRAVK